MRISDWSSDVCSSDLVAAGNLDTPIEAGARYRQIRQPTLDEAQNLVAATLGSDEIGVGRIMIEQCLLVFGEPEEPRSEEHTSELQSLMRISYAVFCLKKKHKTQQRCSTHSSHRRKQRK